LVYLVIPSKVWKRSCKSIISPTVKPKSFSSGYGKALKPFEMQLHEREMESSVDGRSTSRRKGFKFQLELICGHLGALFDVDWDL
jgi:hypothetical protein